MPFCSLFYVDAKKNMFQNHEGISESIFLQKTTNPTTSSVLIPLSTQCTHLSQPIVSHYAEPNWINIEIEANKAKIHLSYKKNKQQS
jgi:hypothetical protein